MIQIFYREAGERAGSYRREWLRLELGPFPVTLEDFNKVREEELRLMKEYVETNPYGWQGKLGSEPNASVAKRLKKHWPHLNSFDTLILSIWVKGKHVRAEAEGIDNG